MIKLGIVMIILSVVVFIAALAVPDALKPFSSLFCKPNEALTSDTVIIRQPGEISSSSLYYCVNSEDQARDVTESVVGSATIAFIALLLTGMGVVFYGASRAARQVANISVGDVVTTLRPGEGFTVSVSTDAQANGIGGRNATIGELVDGLKRGVIHLGGQEISLEDLKAGTYQIESGGRPTLTNILQQLEEARTRNLISEDEYRRLRQEALDKLV